MIIFAWVRIRIRIKNNGSETLDHIQELEDVNHKYDQPYYSSTPYFLNHCMRGVQKITYGTDHLCQRGEYFRGTGSGADTVPFGLAKYSKNIQNLFKNLRKGVLVGH